MLLDRIVVKTVTRMQNTENVLNFLSQNSFHVIMVLD